MISGALNHPLLKPNYYPKGKSVGVSNTAYAMECDYGLYARKWSFATIQWFTERAIEFYELPKLPINWNGRITRTWGRFMMRGIKGWHMKASSIEFGEYGLCIGTVLHEVAHYYNLEEDDGPGKHSWEFRRLHEGMIRDFVRGNIVDLNRLLAVEKLEYLWISDPGTYERHHTEDRDSLEMVAAIEAEVGPIKLDGFLNGSSWNV